MTVKCRNCTRRFPDGLIQDLCVNGSYRRVCPLCALQIRNELHGLPPDTPFTGEVARDLYERAVAHLNRT